MSKIYSVVVKGQRIDFTDADLEAIRKGETKTDGGRTFVHLFSKSGRVDLLKEDFDKQMAKSVEAPKAPETPEAPKV
jgi:hypothetical protein